MRIKNSMANRPILSKVVAKEGSHDSFECSIDYTDTKIDIQIECDENAVGDVLDFVESIPGVLDELIVEAKNIISRDLLETYNTNWTESLVVSEDGTTETFSQSKLTSQEFKNQFILDSIFVCGISIIQFWYKTNELFGGHTVFVNSLDGTNFKKAKAEYYG